jgi:hypothetical protein
MAAVESEMLQLGTEAPGFSLPDPEGRLHGLREDARAYLVMFICNHCPFVKHVADELAAIGRDYLPRNVDIVAINSNDVEAYPADGPEAMQKGPIAVVQEGDRIEIDIEKKKMTLKLDDDVIQKRLSQWTAPEPKITGGYMARYARMVSSADKGAVFKSD